MWADLGFFRRLALHIDAHRRSEKFTLFKAKTEVYICCIFSKLNLILNIMINNIYNKYKLDQKSLKFHELESFV